MDILEAKKLVIAAGKELTKVGLVVRTWGNISCRISDTEFVITPSGKPYETLTEDDIVKVNVYDLSYEGDVKPSSEKGIHAQCYLLRQDVNFVIHTHQMNASIISTLGVDIKNIKGKSAQIIGDEILTASYGLPGTKKLRKGVIDVLQNTSSNALIMAHHGALCFGGTYEEAYNVANEVETVCAKYVMHKFKEITGKAADSLDTVAAFIGDKFRKGDQAVQYEKYDSERRGENVILLDKDGNELFEIVKNEPAKPEEPREAGLHMAVYNKRKDVNYIIHSDLPDVHAYSIIGRKMKPLLDDFAQIAGSTVRCVNFNGGKKAVRKVGKALKGGRNAVIIKDNGALCCGKDKYNAEATEMVVEKNSKAYTGAILFDKIDPINTFESKLMNIVYRLKYSKQAK